MKILHVIPYLTPKRGGDVAVCNMLSKQLVQRGHEVTILTTDFEFDKTYAKDLEDCGVNIVVTHCLINIKLFLFSPSMGIWLRKRINEFNIIHLHDFRSYQNILVNIYSNKFKVPYILQAHGDIPIILEKHSLKKLYDLIFGSKILNDAVNVIALTNIEADQYKKMNVNTDKIKIVPNAIDLSQFNILPQRGEFFKKYSLNNDERIILYLGRLHRIKGIDLLIEAFSDLLKEYLNIRLVIVGPDEGFLSTLRKQIECLNISENVLFTGPLYGKEKLAAYVDADVYVLPSIYESFPMTILEACACGTPVIVTNRCGIADLVNGKLGYSVEYDKIQLKDCLIKLLRDSNFKEQINHEKNKFFNEFNWNNSISKLIKIYADCGKYPK